MIFTQPSFFVFFVMVFVLSRLAKSWTLRKLLLLAASYVFYATWNPPFVLLIMFSTLVDYFAALGMQKYTKASIRKLLMVLSLIANLGLLATFKYASFLADNFVLFAGQAGWEVELTPFSLILPVGISFYTFQSLSYSIDVYREKLKPTHNLFDFALFVSFFPQLVAGPIVRASEFMPQLKSPRRASAQQVYWGVLLFIFGLFKKVYLADATFGEATKLIFTHSSAPGTLETWVGVYAFAGQIYCDFSGYTDMAIGCALALGFVLPDNFRRPYGAIGFSDFWRRWHISLSNWLRDYLYIPLGGNRKGAIRTKINLALTMLLGGLWHGASWTFVIWGALHGAYLAVERAIVKYVPKEFGHSKIMRLFLAILTFHLVCFAWVFFASPDIETALRLASSLLSVGPQVGHTILSRFMTVQILLYMAIMIAVHIVWRNRSLEEASKRAGWTVTALVAGVMLFLAIASGATSDEFIYFQF
ncbi:MAG: MBOAT family O-acyltransferase [Planctomycetota bacterium]